MNTQYSESEEHIKNIRTGEALVSLMKDPNFILVFEKAYFTDELIKASLEFTHSDSEVVKTAHSRIEAIARLKEWIESISNIAANSKNDLGE